MTTEGLNVMAKARASGSHEGEAWTSAVAPYEDWIRNITATADALSLGGQGTTSLSQVETDSQDTQAFLAESLSKLEAFKAKAEQKSDASKAGQRAIRRTDDSEMSSSARQAADAQVSEHIGPVQFNMGGIQVDADDMVQRLKDRQAYTATPDQPASPAEKTGEAPEVMDTDNLQAFFSGLMNRKGGGSSNSRTAAS
jgi:dynein light intermediate chain 1